MASNVDDTIPEDGRQVRKSLIRGNFAAAKDEITDLQAQQRTTRFPYRLAFFGEG